MRYQVKCCSSAADGSPTLMSYALMMRTADCHQLCWSVSRRRSWRWMNRGSSPRVLCLPRSGLPLRGRSCTSASRGESWKPSWRLRWTRPFLPFIGFPLFTMFLRHFCDGKALPRGAGVSERYVKHLQSTTALHLHIRDSREVDKLTHVTRPQAPKSLAY